MTSHSQSSKVNGYLEPPAQAAVLPDNAIELAQIKIQIKNGSFIVSSTGIRFDENLSSHLGLIHPVADQIEAQVKKNLPKAEAEKVIKMFSKSSETNLPFWYNQPFEIVMREVIVNAVESIWKSRAALGQIDISVNLKNQALEITVSDNGNGISDADRRNVFREGWTSKRNISSPCGNGLYYSRRFVREIMNGEMDICDRSKQNPQSSGATVTIKFPLD